MTGDAARSTRRRPRAAPQGETKDPTAAPPADALSHTALFGAPSVGAAAWLAQVKFLPVPFATRFDVFADVVLIVETCAAIMFVLARVTRRRAWIAAGLMIAILSFGLYANLEPWASALLIAGATALLLGTVRSLD